MIILFPYFICLINLQKIVKDEFKLYYLLIYTYYNNYISTF